MNLRISELDWVYGSELGGLGLGKRRTRIVRVTDSLTNPLALRLSAGNRTFPARKSF